MKTLSKVLLVTILFSFTFFNSSAEADSNNYRSSYIGHGGDHPAAHIPAHASAHNTGHGEHSTREQQRTCRT
ncbi:hypothetical protein [Arsenophonus endosymbiont of Aleurodicus floccissimus]|uniref:hypothetical protein n=1 Tax=Arsenophonus endosymbiont of Aleurodicus floccissimus TaxID=2152761 RepID=UPI000E6B4276|nr:hypothetical protein [Arsenophonus endosymbiont of Aleurodicus floccissimus]